MSLSAKPAFPLKPTHKSVKDYYAALAQFQRHGHTTEGNTRAAFADLLKKCCSPYHWHLVEEYAFKGTAKQSLRADGALVDDLTLVHGIWEAKDSNDDLEAEIKAKVKKGYPLTNILFQSPSHAVLYQDSRIAFNDAITDPEKLIEVLTLFCDHKQPHEVDWETAVTKFAEEIPKLAKRATSILETEYVDNTSFHENFDSFANLCRQSINPELADDAIFKMLVQHLLTERIFRKVFDNDEFLRRNVIAVEIEKVISSITARHFSRGEFLKDLDRFYSAIEQAAESQNEYTEKQHFLNAVYEKFFQRFDTKQADTMGIVYTPQPIVDFMVRSVDEILQQEFGKTLSDKGVHILDPFTGTGNFITRIMQQIKRSALPHKYAEELHCNEVMLLPYYIASMNIEHAFMERGNAYAPFEGICLVDTFETLGQSNFFTSVNTERVRRQARAEVRVVVGNPPYNMGQDSEDKKNRNRKYNKPGQVDARIAKTYSRDSTAQLKNKLGDPYVKAFRWASDRIGDTGVVCYVTNNKFLTGLATDGMRKHLAQDFNLILHIDFKGNANTAGERRRKEGGNIFNDMIKVGVGITFLLKNPARSGCVIRLLQVDDYLSAREKVILLKQYATFSGAPLEEIIPDKDFNWLELDGAADFDEHKNIVGEEGIFCSSSPGVNSARDAYLYNWSAKKLFLSAKSMTKAYTETLGEYIVSNPEDVESFTDADDSRIKWSPLLWRRLIAKQKPPKPLDKITTITYRPFTSQNFYPDAFWIERPGILTPAFPKRTEDNRIISVTAGGSSSGFFTLATASAVDFHFVGDSQCFAFLIFDKEDEEMRENIDDLTLLEFRSHYTDQKISKLDIFHATYAVLHHPEYRTRYAANLKRELPRIPFPPDLHAFAAAGKRLMDLHIDYEKQAEFPLEQIEDPKAKVSFRVEKMKLSKDKTELRYNDFLLLRGIPAAAFDYRLGNRSALEWVIDQYRVSTDPRSGIVNDPNREDDPQYILRLIGQVITVSLETQQIIASLPSLELEKTA